MKNKISKWFERFRNEVIARVRKECARNDLSQKPVTEIDTQIGLGALLWSMGAIAGADGKFLPEEDREIENIILSHTKTLQSDLSIISTAIKQAAIGNINVYRIVRQINKTLPHQNKVSLIEDLFRVAYADKSLDNKEFTIIKKVADLFGITKESLSCIESTIKKEGSI